MKYITMLIVAFGHLSWVYAGNEHGNGGDVVVCREESGKIQSIELLDYYEGNLYRKIKVDLGEANLSLTKKLELLSRRLAQKDSKLSDLYFQRALKFEREAIFVEGVDLEDIPDSGNVTVARNCKIEQIVIQKNPTYELDKRYTVNTELWNALDNDNKVGLIWHEMIYGDAASRGVQDSISSRFLNVLLAGDKLNQLSFMSLKKLFLDLKLETFVWNNLTINLSFDSLNSGIVEAGKYNLFGQIIDFEKSGKTFIQFYENGNVAFVGGGDYRVFEYKTAQDGIIKFRTLEGLQLHPNGSLAAATLVEDHKFKVRQSIIECKKGNWFRLDSDGLLKSCTINQVLLKNSKVDVSFSAAEANERFELEFTDKDGFSEFKSKYWDAWDITVNGQISVKGHWIKIKKLRIGIADSRYGLREPQVRFNTLSNEKIEISDQSLELAAGAEVYMNQFENIVYVDGLRPKSISWKLANNTFVTVSDRIECKGLISNKAIREPLYFYENESLNQAILVQSADLYEMNLLNMKTYNEGVIIEFSREGGVSRTGYSLCR